MLTTKSFHYGFTRESVRGKLAGASTMNMQRDHMNKHNVEGFISHQGLKGHFLGVFIQTGSRG